MNVTFYAKILFEHDKSIGECRFIKMNVFLNNEFAVGINNSIFSGNEQQKV